MVKLQLEVMLRKYDVYKVIFYFDIKLIRLSNQRQLRKYFRLFGIAIQFSENTFLFDKKSIYISE